MDAVRAGAAAGSTVLARAPLAGRPCLWLVMIRSVPADLGVAGALASAWVVAAAVRRAWVAIRCNHRYQFTTWRWARVLGWLLLIGIVLKVAMAS